MNSTCRRSNALRRSHHSVVVNLLVVCFLCFHQSWVGAAASSPFARNNNNNDRSSSHSNNINSNDPYNILGVPTEATQDEIQKSYRKLCLRFHPDKNVQASPAVRQKCEDTFKRIQKAYSQVGDAESRRQYDRVEAFRRSGFGGSATSGTTFPSSSWTTDGYQRNKGSFHDDYQRQRGRAYQQNPNSVYEDLLQQLFGFSTSTSRSSHHHHPRSSFSYGFSTPFGNTMNGQQGRSFFPTTSPSSTMSSPSSPASSSPSTFSNKAIFVQKVEVSLEDLYRGVSQLPVRVQVNSLWSRLTAAFRGGIGYALLYQSMLFALPFVRLSKWVAAAMGIYLFYLQLPQALHDERYFQTQQEQQQQQLDEQDDEDEAVLYHIDVEPGYKGGTKLVFQGRSNSHHADSWGDSYNTMNRGDDGVTIEIVLILQEKKHKRFQRIGNDLHTNIKLSARQARRGCAISIPNLNAPPTATTNQHDDDSNRRNRRRRGRNNNNKNNNHADDGDDPSLTKVTVPPQTQKGDTIIVPGQGWYNRKTKQHGDLIIHIQRIHKNSSSAAAAAASKSHHHQS